MPYCVKCGEKVEAGVEYCPKCGASMSKPEGRGKEEAEMCFGMGGRGLWGSIWFGIFLIGLAILWYFDLWWPGLLFLVGIMIIISGILAYRR